MLTNLEQQLGTSPVMSGDVILAPKQEQGPPQGDRVVDHCRSEESFATFTTVAINSHFQVYLSPGYIK